MCVPSHGCTQRASCDLDLLQRCYTGNQDVSLTKNNLAVRIRNINEHMISRPRNLARAPICGLAPLASIGSNPSDRRCDGRTLAQAKESCAIAGRDNHREIVALTRWCLGERLPR